MDGTSNYGEEYKVYIDDWAKSQEVCITDYGEGRRGDKIKFKVLKGELKGLQGTTTRQNILNGHRPRIFFLLTPADKNIHMARLVQRVGAHMLGQYTDIKTPIRVLITEGRFSGYQGTITPESIILRIGKPRKDFRITVLTPAEKVRYITNTIEDRGYEVLSLPKEPTKGKMTLLSPQGNKWKVTWAQFTSKQDGKYPDCPTDLITVSYGARIVHTILKANGVDYIAEEPVKTGITYQYLDFWLPKHNLAIEYHGRQHYEETNKGESLAAIQERDRRKARYCKDRGIRLLVIPYTNNTIEKVIAVLKAYLVIDVVPLRVDAPQVLPNKDIVEYYKTHTREEVKEKYGVKRSVLERICRMESYVKPQERAVIATNIVTGEENEYPTIHSAEATGAHGIAECCNGLRKQSNGCTWRYKDESHMESYKLPKKVKATESEIMGYYANHSKPQTVKHFKGLTVAIFSRLIAASGYNRKNYVVRAYCINTDEVTEYTSKAEAERQTGSRDIHEPLESGKGITKVGDNTYYTWSKEGKPFDEDLIKRYKINIWLYDNNHEILRYLKTHTTKETAEYFKEPLQGQELTPGNLKALYRQAGLKNKAELKKSDLF